VFVTVVVDCCGLRFEFFLLLCLSMNPKKWLLSIGFYVIVNEWLSVGLVLDDFAGICLCDDYWCRFV